MMHAIMPTLPPCIPALRQKPLHHHISHTKSDIIVQEQRILPKIRQPQGSKEAQEDTAAFHYLAFMWAKKYHL